MESLLLLSSDDRQRYAEDVQTVLAAPEGANVQYRYRQKWVAPALQRAATGEQLKGRSVVLGFIGSSGDPFVLPIRYATVTKVERLADIFIFRLRIGGYVNLRNYPLSLPEIVELSRSTLNQLTMNEDNSRYTATSISPRMPDEVTDDMPARWMETAQRLSLHPTFETSYFLRVAPVETQQGKRLRFDASGQVVTTDSQSLRIATIIHTRHFIPDTDFTLTCTPGSPSVRVTSDDVYRVTSSHDSVEFWLHLAAQNYDTLSRITISLASETDIANAVPVHVRLPLAVHRSRARVIQRWAAASVGAVLVALPAILGPGSALELRIGSALLGASLLALSGAVLSTPK
jgi:hypothetical protein